MIDQLLWIKNHPIAHRGLHSNDSEIPENSMKAFSNALNHGYAIELDVHILKDLEVVVFHDYDLQRMCGPAKFKIEELSSVEIKQFKLLKSDQGIPLLSEVLKMVNGRVPLLIEIKRQPYIKDANQIILNCLLSYRGPVAIQSFDPLILRWFAENAPLFIRGQLAGGFDAIKMNEIQKYFLKTMRLNFLSKPHFVAYEIQSLPNKVITKLQQRGIPVLAWIITSQAQLDSKSGCFDNYIFEGFLPAV